MEILDFVAMARREQVSERTTSTYLGITCRTLQNWRRKGLRDKRKGSTRHVPHRLSQEERDAIYALATSMRFADSTPEQIIAILAQEGVYIASSSSLSRILRTHKATSHRQESKKPVVSLATTRIPITNPNQVWAWDITWLKTEVRGIFLYAYTIIDLYDRSIIGWTIEDHESDAVARTLFARITRDLHVIPHIVHADNGNPMRGMTLAVFLDSLLISRSYSRPRCSNDNAFIESWHKTLKYTVGYPNLFTSIDHARIWYADFIQWYNTEHLHSGLDYVTPLQARTGEALGLYSLRNTTISLARAAHPDRWRTKNTRTYALPTVEAFYRPLQNVG